ncbi:9444_t:CDS:2, partial [Cetraspora pellucida]
AIEQKFVKVFKYDSFRDLKMIGRGGFGAVYSAYSKNTKKHVALKSLQCNDDDNSSNGPKQECYKLEKYDEALVDLNKSLEINPNSAEVLRQCGVTYRLMNKYEESVVIVPYVFIFKSNW